MGLTILNIFGFNHYIKGIEMIIISSQRYLDQDIVDAKKTHSNYAVTYIDIIINGIGCRIILDDHHSYRAATQSRSPINWIESNLQSELDYMGIDDFLECYYIDSPYYNVETGDDIEF